MVTTEVAMLLALMWTVVGFNLGFIFGAWWASR